MGAEASLRVWNKLEGMEQAPWLFMKRLILNYLRTRTNTSFLVCPQIKGYVGLFIPQWPNR